MLKRRRRSEGPHLVACRVPRESRALDAMSESRHRRGEISMRTPIVKTAASVALAVAGLLMFTLVALAVHDLGLFELDRNAQDPGGGPLPDDWATLYGGGGNAEEFTGVLPDIGSDGGTQLQGGGSKDDLDITQWLWKDGEPLDKDDITEAYSAAYAYTGPLDCAPGETPPSIFCTEP